jgi:hypothetical protein
VTIGILAYGSIKNNPGKEIEGLLVKCIENVKTPFKIEFAHASIRRNGAPTLTPVEEGGLESEALIIVLNDGVDEADAASVLWRRETNNVGNIQKKYFRPKNPNENSVLIERLENFQGVDVVLYTKIGVNIEPLTSQRLAELSIKSAQSKTVFEGRDGVSYLLNSKNFGIKTPLMGEYEKEILRLLSVDSLEQAVENLRFQQLQAEGKIPKDTQILTKPPTIEDAGKNVMFRAVIGRTFIKLSPPIVLSNQPEGEKTITSYETLLLDQKVEFANGYLYVGFKTGTDQQDVSRYFNNLIALFNIIQIPFDFASISEILVEAKGLGTGIELVASSKAHRRGIGIFPVEIQTIDFAKICMAVWVLWTKIKRSKYFDNDECFLLLGYAHYYLFHENFFLSFVHSWMFLEASINILWQKMISETFSKLSSAGESTPLENDRNWTAQIKIEELFLKKKIDENLRKDLQLTREKRNKVFHRDKDEEKRIVNSQDASDAALLGLRLLYSMIETDPEKGIIAYLDVKAKMWETVNRGKLYRNR